MNKFNHSRIETNGTCLNVIDEGKGEPVLLLHGFPDSHQVWRHQIPVLVAAGYRVIAPDLRGYGESEISNIDDVSLYKPSNLAKDVIGLLDALNLPKVHLVGHDFGAALGWTVTLTYPERVLQYTTLSVGHPYAYKNLGGIVQWLKGWYTKLFNVRHIAEAIYTFGNFKSLRSASGNHPEATSHWIPDMSRPGRLTAALNWYRGVFAENKEKLPTQRTSVPILAVWGENDAFLGRQQMVQSCRFVDSFQYVEIENAGHWISLDVPEQINTLLIKRLEQYSGVLDAC